MSTRDRIVATVLAGFFAGCGETPVEVEPEYPVWEVTSGTITVRVDVPLPPHLLGEYYDSAFIAVQSWEQSLDLSKLVGDWTKVQIRDSVVVIADLPFIQPAHPSHGAPYNDFRVAFHQPRVDGWGDRGWGTPTFIRFSEWIRLDAANPTAEVEHAANYSAAMRGTGYLSGCYYEGTTCHRDKWIFKTGPVRPTDGTFTEGETHVILVDQRFLSRRDTIASGTVTGTYRYPDIQMHWDVYGGCSVTGELYHRPSGGRDKWLEISCPNGLRIEGRWY